MSYEDPQSGNQPIITEIPNFVTPQNPDTGPQFSEPSIVHAAPNLPENFSNAVPRARVINPYGKEASPKVAVESAPIAQLPRQPRQETVTKPYIPEAHEWTPMEEVKKAREEVLKALQEEGK